MRECVPGVAFLVGSTKAHRKVIAEDYVDVGPQVDPVLGVPGDDSRRVPPIAGDEVADGLGATGDTQVVGLRKAITEKVAGTGRIGRDDIRVPLGDQTRVIVVDVELDEFCLWAVVFPSVPSGRCPVIISAGAASKLMADCTGGMDHVVRSHTCRHRELRRAHRTPLGDDLDHARRRLGSVEGRRGRTFDDFDTLDVLGVDVVQRAAPGSSRVAAAVVIRVPILWTQAEGIVDPDAVHVDKGLVTDQDAGEATDINGRSRPEAPGTSGEVEAGRSCSQHLLHGGDGDLCGDRCRVNDSNRVPDRPPLCTAHRPCDDDRVEL